MTLKPSHQPAPTSGELMSSAAGSHAKTSATLGIGQESAANDPVCGLSMSGSLAWYDLDSLLWRTWQRCFIEGWELFSETFPDSGLMRSGRLFRRAPWVLHTHGKDCSLWPTPTASMGQNGWGINLNCLHGYRPDVGARCAVSGWRPHPELIETLMGFPIHWTDLGDSETPLCPKSQSGLEDA